MRSPSREFSIILNHQQNIYHLTQNSPFRSNVMQGGLNLSLILRKGCMKVCHEILEWKSALMCWVWRGRWWLVILELEENIGEGWKEKLEVKLLSWGRMIDVRKHQLLADLRKLGRWCFLSVLLEYFYSSFVKFSFENWLGGQRL